MREKDIALSLAEKAKDSHFNLLSATTQQKNEVLRFMIKNLKRYKKEIIKANSLDLKEGKKKNLNPNLIQRLVFDERKIHSRIRSLREIINLPDPVGRIENYQRQPAGIESGRIRVPFGVILLIYESRPHVTINGAALSIKSGNCIILRGGSETINTNLYLQKLWKEALRKGKLGEDIVQVVPQVSHKLVSELLKLKDYIDLVIPRGGKSLITTVERLSKIPVIKHSQGICHIYVDKSADLDKAERICLNSKILMPEVCNAVETILIDEKIAKEFLPPLIKSFKKNKLEVRGDAQTRKIVPEINKAIEVDWKTEYLDLIISIKVVKDQDEALEHIAHYGSHHTEVIISENYGAIKKFIREVDSGVVIANASTMFNDGFSLGMGAEIGISTDKLQARGPMGIYDLTTYKWVIFGEGQIMG